MPQPPIHAFTDDALRDDDAVGVAQRLAQGEISHREVIAAAIARCEQVNPQLHALVSERFEAARCEQPPRNRAFSGV
ncbi:MAG: amidase, partial [Oleiphilaceae bacterium]|nr:amidase [Oleiphilaceae bacterium]